MYETHSHPTEHKIDLDAQGVYALDVKVKRDPTSTGILTVVIESDDSSSQYAVDSRIAAKANARVMFYASKPCTLRVTVEPGSAEDYGLFMHALHVG